MLILMLGCALFFVRYLEDDDHPTPSMQAPMDLLQVATALEFYRDAKGSYPSEEEGLRVLADRFLPESELSDGWGTPIRYVQVSLHGQPSYRLCSAGADGEFTSGAPGDDYCFSPARGTSPLRGYLTELSLSDLHPGTPRILPIRAPSTA